MKSSAQNVSLILGIRCPKPGHSLPKPCSLDAQALFIRCPSLVHPMPKPCSSVAQALVHRLTAWRSVADQLADMPKGRWMDGRTLYILCQNDVSMTFYYALWCFYDTSMTLLWYFSVNFMKSVIVCNSLYIRMIKLKVWPVMILWHFFIEKTFIRARVRVRRQSLCRTCQACLTLLFSFSSPFFSQMLWAFAPHSL